MSNELNTEKKLLQTLQDELEEKARFKARAVAEAARLSRETETLYQEYVSQTEKVREMEIRGEDTIEELIRRAHTPLRLPSLPKKPKKVEEPPRPQECPPASLIESCQIVIGSREMTPIEVYEELKQRKWLPISDNPLYYVRYTLSKEKEIFLRDPLKRGVYHLSPDNQFYGTPSPSGQPAAKKEPKQKSAKKKKPNPLEGESPEAVVDRILALF